MSVVALTKLMNGRDTIKALICEWYFLAQEEIEQMKIARGGADHAGHKEFKQHGLWQFCYHEDENKVHLL